MADASPAESSPSPTTSLDQEALFTDLLDRLPAEVQTAALVAAIPRRINPSLLDAILDAEMPMAAASMLLDRLAEVGWVQPEGADFVMSTDLRLRLVRRLQSTPAHYQLYHQRAAVYFAHQTGRDDDVQRRTLCYHLLIGDPDKGIAHLRTAADDALDGFRPGSVERLLDDAEEHGSLLSSEAAAWIDFYRGRLTLLLDDSEIAAEHFRRLTTPEHSFPVRGAAFRMLAQSEAYLQRWTPAFDAATEAQHIFRSSGDAIELGRTLVVRADIFVRLTEATGGLQPETERLPDWRNRVDTLIHAPFLLYRWLTRRLDWLPNLYFGSDYQDWIVVRYLYAAVRALEAADRHFTSTRPDTREQINARIRLADLYHQVGRWRRSERLFLTLSRSPQVQENNYLQALIGYAQGRAASLRGEMQRAITLLHTSHKIMLESGDQATAAATARLLSIVYGRKQELNAALEYALLAAEEYIQIHDWLSATEMLSAVEKLVVMTQFFELASFAEDHKSTQTASPASMYTVRALALREQMGRQLYVERFPGLLHPFFRRLAVYFAAPITFLLIYIFSLSIEGVVALFEFTVVAFLDAGAAASVAGDLALAAPLLLVFPLVVAWLYELLYAGIGLFCARGLPLAFLLRDSPRHLLLTLDQIGVYDAAGKQTTLLAWEQVDALISQDKAIWNKSSRLFSQTLLLGKDGRWLVVKGIVNGYNRLKLELTTRIHRAQPEARLQSLDFQALGGRWGWGALLLILLVGTVAYFDLLDSTNRTTNYLAVISPDGSVRHLYITGYISRLLNWTVYLAPLVGLTHLLLHRRHEQQELGAQAVQGANWPIGLAWVLLLLMTLAELYIATL